MNVKILVGAEAAYACIKLSDLTLDIKLEPGRSAQQALRDWAEEMRKKSLRLDRDAMLASLAANQLDHDAFEKTVCVTSHC